MSSSCYDDSPTESSEDDKLLEVDENDSDEERTVVITHTKVVARRFEFWHEKFLSYSEILEYLVKLSEFYQHKCNIERLGYSKENRPICLMNICSNNLKHPQMRVLIEAGSNGSEKMTVSSILYLIDYLVKNNHNLLVEFLIIPCFNPDGYEKCFKKRKIPKKKQKEFNMSKSFPINLDRNKNMVRCDSDVPPNCLFLTDVLAKYGKDVKLFISMQASESAITYPLDNYFKDVFDFAVACKNSMEWYALDVKPIVPTLTLDRGTSVEHIIRNYSDSIKFAYILNVHNNIFVPEEKFILPKGEQVLNGILTLTKRVYRFYKKQNTHCNVKTVVKLLNSSE